jgi:hypothetical protein
VHCVVPAGGLSPDQRRWISPQYSGFFLPVKVLSRDFRGKFVEQLRRTYTRGQLDLTGASEHLRNPVHWHAFVHAPFTADWVVYVKPAFAGASAILRYLGRSTRARRIRRRTFTRLVPDGGRRRSRGDGPLIGHRPRPEIPISAP